MEPAATPGGSGSSYRHPSIAFLHAPQLASKRAENPASGKTALARQSHISLIYRTEWDMSQFWSPCSPMRLISKRYMVNAM